MMAVELMPMLLEGLPSAFDINTVSPVPGLHVPEEEVSQPDDSANARPHEVV